MLIYLYTDKEENAKISYVLCTYTCNINIIQYMRA